MSTYSKAAINFSQFIFAGDRNTYAELMAKHDQDLAIAKIGYIKNPLLEITRRTTELLNQLTHRK
jgi:hypothetical protein